MILFRLSPTIVEDCVKIFLEYKFYVDYKLINHKNGQHYNKQYRKKCSIDGHFAMHMVVSDVIITLMLLWKLVSDSVLWGTSTVAQDSGLGNYKVKQMFIYVQMQAVYSKANIIKYQVLCNTQSFT